MSLADIIRSAVATAYSVTNTGELLDTVSHEAYSSQNADGEATYSAAVSRTALVERKQRVIRLVNGHETVSNSKVTFLSNVTVTDRDRITLSDGTTAPILKRESLLDASGDPYIVEVWLG